MSANVTVDDSDSSIIYTAGWKSQGCAGCSAVPTPAQMPLVYGGTYHDATVFGGGLEQAVFSFNGTAVYVYGWTVSTTEQPSIKNQDMTFLIDSAQAGEFKHSPGPENEFDLLFFKQDGLPSGLHTLTIVVNPPSLTLLDYIVFTESTGEDTLQPHRVSSNPLENIPSQSTSPDPSSAGYPSSATGTNAINAAPGTASSSSSQPSATFGAEKQQSSSGFSAGIVAGVLIPLFLAIVGATIFFLWRRKHRQAKKAAITSSRQFLIDDEPDMMIYAPNAGAPLSRYCTASPAPHTPTLARPYLDPGTSAYFDPRDLPQLTPLNLAVLAPPPAARSPMRVNATRMPSPVQRVPTPSELPLPLGPPTEVSDVTYPDELDLPRVAPPMPPPPPRVASPVAGSPLAVGRQSMRRLVVYNAPSDLSASDENGGATEGRRRKSPPPPLPVPRRR